MNISINAVRKAFGLPALPVFSDIDLRRPVAALPSAMSRSFDCVLTELGGPDKAIYLHGKDGLRITIAGLPPEDLRALADDLFTEISVTIKGADSGH